METNLATELFSKARFWLVLSRWSIRRLKILEEQNPSSNCRTRPKVRKVPMTWGLFHEKWLLSKLNIWDQKLASEIWCDLSIKDGEDMEVRESTVTCVWAKSNFKVICLFIYRFMMDCEYSLEIPNSFICSFGIFAGFFFFKHILPLQVWAVNLFCFY